MSKKNLPAPKQNPNGTSDEDSEGSINVTVENFHYAANDIAELSKLADKHPVLADKLVDQKDRSEARVERSFRIGLVCTTFIAVSLFLGVVYTIVELGFVQTLVVVVSMLGISHLLRVILTGEWSDTSWFGKLIDGTKGQKSEKKTDD